MKFIKWFRSIVGNKNSVKVQQPHLTTKFSAATERLNAAFIASNKVTHPAYDPDAILDQLQKVVGNAVVPDSLSIPSPVQLALFARDNIHANKLDDAEALARLALSMQPNNLFLQGLLREATGVQEEPTLKKRFCPAPFENIETQPNGDVYFCCPAWLPVPIGNLKEGDVNKIWNSLTAQEIRSSVHDGSFRYCSRVHCPKLSGHKLPKAESLTNQSQYEISRTKRINLGSPPKKIILSHDRSCNLSCPSCRTETIIARKSEQSRLNKMADNIIFPLLENADRVRITASGDPFGSAHFQYILRNLDRVKNPKLRLDLQTNGVLLTPKLWRTLALDGRVDNLIISIDAAEKKTYEVLRRGGNFDALIQNLSFISNLRRDGRIRHLRLDFVVQDTNFLEMPEFVILALEYNSDSVKFQMIRNWGTYTHTEFSKVHINNPTHPKYKEFIRVLRKPEFSSPYVELWGMEEAVVEANKLSLARTKY